MTNMRFCVGVAIWAGGEVRGSLYVTDRRDGKQFDEAGCRVGHAARVA